jgi:hypothetical protein
MHEKKCAMVGWILLHTALPLANYLVTGITENAL